MFTHSTATECVRPSNHANQVETLLLAVKVNMHCSCNDIPKSRNEPKVWRSHIYPK